MSKPLSYHKQIAFRQPEIGGNAPSTLEHVIDLLGRESNKIKGLEAILPYALAVSQAEVGALLVIDNDAKNMAVVTRHGMPDEVIGQLTRGALGHLLLMGQWVRVEPKPLQLNPEQALLGRHELKYLLGIPLQFGGQVLGALVVGVRTPNRTLTQPEQEQPLIALAQLVGLFLDHLRLRQSSQRPPQTKIKLEPEVDDKTVQELEALLEAVMSAEEEVAYQNNDLGLLNALSGQVGSSLQLSTVLKMAIQQSQQALKSQVGWCYLFENGVLTLREQQGLSEQYVAGMQHLKPGDGIEGMAFTRNEPFLRDGLLFHSGKARSLVKNEGLRTIAAAPLTNEGKPFGVLALADRHERNWSPRDERMFISISRQVAQAIINSQRFMEAEEEAHRWHDNYTHLQQTNQQLTEQVALLKQQLQDQRLAQQQIWTTLAASSQARHGASTLQTNEQLLATLKKALGNLGKEKKLRPL